MFIPIETNRLGLVYGRQELNPVMRPIEKSTGAGVRAKPACGAEMVTRLILTISNTAQARLFPGSWLAGIERNRMVTKYARQQQKPNAAMQAREHQNAWARPSGRPASSSFGRAITPRPPEGPGTPLWSDEE